MVIGIDLGTTNSSCAVFDGREIVLIPNERGSRTTPSVVFLGDQGEVLVGESAKNQAILNPGRTIKNAKRSLGSKEGLPFGDASIRAEKALSYILRSLRNDAEEFLGVSITEAVVTVPAYFSETQRRAVVEAGRLSGIGIRRLLNEPTAAAIAWAWSVNRNFETSAQEERKVLVYDLGGGTFDATVLAMRGRSCRVLSTSGNNNLGGADFDELLMREASAHFEDLLGPGVVRDDPSLGQQLRDLVERAKIDLSVRKSASVMLPFAGRSAAAHPVWNIDRGRFEELISPFIETTIGLCMKAVEDAGLGLSSLDCLVLSGGSSRIPLVRKRLAEALGLEPESRINPEEVVSIGAAVYAGLAEGRLTGLDIEDAVSRSFGVEIDGDEFIPLILKNTPIPASKTRAFTTVADDQRTVEIHVLQGESRKASENVSLGRFILTGIRSGKKGEPRIEVEFSIDADEIIHVRARDVDTGVEQGVTIAGQAADGWDADRLIGLIRRAESLREYARKDRSLALEFDEALRDAEGLYASIEDVSRTADTSPDAVESAGVTLSALIVELEARKSSEGSQDGKT